MVDVERVAAGERLRIAVLGDFDGWHTRAWLRWFVERGHDTHAISFYPPRVPLEGVTVHALRTRSDASAGAVVSTASRVPRGLLRLAHALRYRRAGLKGVLHEVDPDVFHAHFLVEHGFYGAVAGFRPYVVTAWGSDVLVEPERDLLSRRIARWTIGRADALTSNNAYMAERMVGLGAPRDRVSVITLGADRYDLERFDESVNVRAGDAAPCVISTRAHEPLYNIDVVIDAFARVGHARGGVRFVVAHRGSLTGELRRRAAEREAQVEFAGYLGRAQFRDALAGAHVFVSVPSSDGTSVALLQAMAAGSFPVVSDLPTQRELIEDGVNGLRVPVRDAAALAAAIERALDDGELRRRAATINRGIVEERGLNEVNMPKLERIYQQLAKGLTPAGGDEARDILCA